MRQMEVLRDQIYGCLVGGAIGDALGAAVENWHYADIRREFGNVAELLPQPGRSRDGQPGQITDDSTLRHYLCQAIIEAGGRLLDRTFPCPPGENWDPERSVAATSREVIPAVVGLLRLCGHDPNHALVEAASFGRDADTIASVLGCMVGALHGASALRPDWMEKCERANAAFFAEAGHGANSFNDTAARLLDALQSERQKASSRADPGAASLSMTKHT
jgi:ADP-ribosylglycohydrolase